MQPYKLKIPKKWRIYDVFHVLLLESDTTRKRRVDKNTTQLEFEPNNNEKYNVERIQDSAVYAKVLEVGHILRLYYLCFGKAT